MKYKENNPEEVNIEQTIEEPIKVSKDIISDLLNLLEFTTEQKHSHVFCDKTIKTLTEVCKNIIKIIYLYDENFTYPQIKEVKQVEMNLDEIVNTFKELANKINDTISKAVEQKEWYVSKVLMNSLCDINDEILCLKHKNDK